MSADERAAITGAWGDRAYLADGSSARGRFEEPQSELRLAEGVSPTFSASRDALDAIGLTQADARGSRIERVETYQQRTTGPYRVRTYEAIGDGAFVSLGLEQLAA